MATMNSESKYEQLVWRVTYVLKSAHHTLNDEKRGLASIGVNDRRVGDVLSWNAEDWMLASAKLDWLNWATQALELAVLECREAIMGDSDDELEAEFNVMLDARAETICAQLASELLRTVLRGVESTSNPMSILKSKANVDAARDLLEGICELSVSALCSSHAIADIFAGRSRRQDEARAAEAKITRKIVYYKGPLGEYYAQPLNSAGNACALPGCLHVTRKADALTAIAAEIKRMRDRGEMQHIAVEAA